MSDRDRASDLDAFVQAVVAGDHPASSIDDELAALAAVADALRHVPSEVYRRELSARLEREALVSSTHAVHHVPTGLRAVTPYLVVRDAPGAIRFYEEVFGAEELARHTDADGRVLHAKVRIGDAVVEVGEHPDVAALDVASPPPVGMHVYVPDADAVFERAVAAGATALYPVDDRPYGDREGGVADPFGIVWWVATHVRD